MTFTRKPPVYVALSWTAASGASKYRVERKSAGSSYDLLTTTTSTSTTDSGASTGSAYLYRVCAADSSGNCTSDYGNIALGAKLNFTTDATICAASDSSCSPLTEMKAAHITELRTAINAVRSLAGQSGGSWTHSTLTAQSSLIYADDLRDLRSALHDALTTLGLQTSNYTDNTIYSYADNPLNATAVKAVHIRELRTRATSGAGNSTSGGSSGGLHYVLTDIQGSTRAVMNNSGSSSAVIARHDYLPFGEEIASGMGSRSLSQGYNASDTNRWKYGMTERDAASGLDHTWWRKYENLSGRWTSPDPLSGSIGDPQSFNHYTYVANDPVNLVDPSGLDPLHVFGIVTVTTSFDPSATTGVFTASILRGEIMVETGEDGGGPQNPTPTDRLIDRARELRDQPSRNDCKALVELIRFAGDLFQNVIQGTNQLGNVLAGGDVVSLGLRAVAGRVTGRHETSQPIVDGFGSAGFLRDYQDFGSSPNQVRHSIGGLLAGSSRGMNGLAAMNANEPDPTGDGAADVRLNGASVPLGAALQLHNGDFGTNRSLAGRDRMRQLAADVEKKLCDPNTK